jgi:hypothetical protein
VRHETELNALLTHTLVPNSTAHSNASTPFKIMERTNYFVFYVIDEKLSEKDQNIMSKKKLFVT